MKCGFIRSLSILLLLCFSGTCAGAVITMLPTSEKVVALTMDGCETKTPSWLDMTILDYLVKEQLPCTIFVSGKFALRNRTELERISKLGFIRIENHSLSHYQHMEKLTQERFAREVTENERIITEITGRKPVLFRFPAGNYDTRSLQAVESLGYKVVHWTFPSGDPSRQTTAASLTRWVLSQTRQGSILIFHINGRGYHTGEALPHIVGELKRKGYRFASLEEFLNLGSEKTVPFPTPPLDLTTGK
jgi:peptidoglycan-N-acetylglucosamine deacetylase